MAELTYSEKAAMASKDSFQQRTWTAFKDHARYWNEFASADPTALYNSQIQKRKRYAKAVLMESGNFASLRAICECLLNFYEVDPPVLDENGELADSELSTSSPAASKTYDQFSGVVAGDESDPIQW
jgi:hypothetical protein